MILRIHQQIPRCESLRPLADSPQEAEHRHRLHQRQPREVGARQAAVHPLPGPPRTHRRPLLADDLGAAIKSHSHAQQNHGEEANQMPSVLAEGGGTEDGVARRRPHRGIPNRRELQELLQAPVPHNRHGVDEVAGGHSVPLHSSSYDSLTEKLDYE